MVYCEAMAKDITIKAPDYMRFLTEEHHNKWVAFSTDYSALIAVADSLPEIVEKTGKKEIAIVKVNNSGFVGRSNES